MSVLKELKESMLKKISSKKIALISTMAALASVLRIPFAVIPSLQPTTFIVAISGYVFGIRAGLMVGILSAVVSNIFLGQGLWTIMQMGAWGLIGIFYGLIGKTFRDFNSKTKWFFSITLFIWGYFFGWFMNLWWWISTAGELSFQTFMGINILSFSFDTTHAVGNFFFAYFFGRDFIGILKRYYSKINYEKV